MDKKITREVDRFWCEGDDGKEYIVVEHRDFLIIEAMGGSRHELAGLLSYTLDDGSGVARSNEEDVFEIVDTGVVLRRS